MGQALQMNLYYRFGIALAIGILVGLEREYAYGDPNRDLFAGVRTFAIMAMVGAVAAMIADELVSPWAFISIVLVLGTLITVAYFVIAWRNDVGMTTEVSALVTILAGALCYWGYLHLAVVIAVVTTVLLSIKLEMQMFVSRITREDVHATLKFIFISIILLPMLPNQPLGPPPLDVLNPYKIWLMVVFISGISFLGYLLLKIAGPRRGIGLTGFLGGLVSSTAVTASFSQRSQTQPNLAKSFALAITVSWTMMFLRVLIEVAVLNFALLLVLWIPIVVSAGVGLVYSIYLYFSQRTDEEAGVDFSNPFKLGLSVKFGLVYAAILLISRATQIYLGETGIYLSSILAGLGDVDAITLSMAELSGAAGGVDQGTATRAIVLAVMANTVAKSGIVLRSGSASLRRAMLPSSVLMVIAGVGSAFLVG